LVAIDQSDETAPDFGFVLNGVSMTLPNPPEPSGAQGPAQSDTVQQAATERPQSAKLPAKSPAKSPVKSPAKWRIIGIAVLVLTAIFWLTAATLTYAIAFLNVSPYWLPVAAAAGFSGEVCLVIGLSLLGVKFFAKRFEAIKGFAIRWRG
jgi:hypothetical protein